MEPSEKFGVRGEGSQRSPEKLINARRLSLQSLIGALGIPTASNKCDSDTPQISEETQTVRIKQDRCPSALYIFVKASICVHAAEGLHVWAGPASACSSVSSLFVDVDPTR